MSEYEYLEKLLDQKFGAFGDLFKLQSEQNTLEHCAIVKRLDYTNGKVRRLEIWKGYLTGGITLLSFLLGFLAFKINF